MKTYQIDPKKQFSKRLARWTAVFWFCFLIWLSIILVIEPDAALFSVYMGIIVTVVMIVNLWTYYSNSVKEKEIFGLIEKKRIELEFGPAKIAIGNNIKGGEENEESNLTEEGGNG